MIRLLERWRNSLQHSHLAGLARQNDARMWTVPAPRSPRDEFAYPIPERHHTLLGNGPDGGWVFQRGYIKGFIDLVFRREQPDVLRRFEGGSTTILLTSRGLAARRVNTGCRREFTQSRSASDRYHNERDYESRFGGLLYVFLRGISRGGDWQDWILLRTRE